MQTEQSTKVTEAEIVARAKLDCIKAIIQLLEIALCPLKQYLYSTNLNHCDIQDISQETMLKTWINLSGFSGKSSFCTWVKRIADQLIKRANRTDKPVFTALTDDLVDPRPSPLEQLIKQEQHQLLQSFIQSLPRVERLVFALHVLEALPYKALCAKTGQKNWAARKAFTRAIIKWEKYLSNEGKNGQTTSTIPLRDLQPSANQKQKHKKINKQLSRQIYRRFLPWTNTNGKKLYSKVPWNEETEKSTHKTSCIN